MTNGLQLKLFSLLVAALAVQEVFGFSYVAEVILLTPLFFIEPAELGIRNIKKGLLWCLPVLPVFFILPASGASLNRFLGQGGIAIGEELFFRGFMMLKFSNLAVSLVFALTHLILSASLQALATFVPSLLFGYLYVKSGSIITPIVWHFSANLVFYSVQNGLQNKAVYTPLLSWIGLVSR